MARRTHNSGRLLSDAAAEELVAEDIKNHSRHSPKSKTQDTKTKTRRSTRKAKAAQSSSSEEEEDADAEEDGESDDEETDIDEPAVLAPSARAASSNGEQAGRSHESVEEDEEQDTPEDDEVETKPTHDGDDDKRGRSSKRSRQNSVLEDSDSDDYAAVEMISDSDGEDPDVEMAEEKKIIADEEYNTSGVLPSALSSNPSDMASVWESLDVTEDFIPSGASFFDEEYGRALHHLPSGEGEIFSPTSVFEGFSPPSHSSSRRHVRFQTPVHAQTDASDLDSDQEDLRVLFQADDNQDGEDAAEPENGEDDGGSSCGSSSGYETDCGETTDEEDVPMTATTKPEALLRRPSLSSIGVTTPRGSAPARASSFKVPTIPASLRRGPRMGTFTTDPRKPVAIVDGSGEHMVIYPAKRPNLTPVKTSLARVPSRSSMSAPATPLTPHATLSAPPDLSDSDFTDMASQISVDPVLSVGPNLGNAAGTRAATTARPAPLFDDLLASQASVFYPLESIEDPENYLLSGAQVDDDDDEDGEDMLDVNDFIDFGESSSDENGENEQITAPVSPTLASESDVKSNFALAKKSPSSSAEDLLRHFDTGVITAFRRGQPHTYSSHNRAHHGPSLTATAMKGGFSMPPSRKRKLSDSLGNSSVFDMAAKRRLLRQP